MPADSFLLGRKARAYFNRKKTKVGGTGSQSDWETWMDLVTGNEDDTLAADNLTDVTLNMASEMADTTTRGTAESGFSSSVPVLKNGEVTFEMRWKPEDPAATGPNYTFTRVLIDAWEQDASVSLAFLDMSSKPTDLPLGIGPGEDWRTQGLAANWSVSLDKSEALRDIQRSSVTLVIVDSAIWYQRNLTAPNPGP